MGSYGEIGMSLQSICFGTGVRIKSENGDKHSAEVAEGVV